MRAEEIRGASIMIVDDQPANVRILEKIFAREGYSNVRATNDPRDVVGMFEESVPDLLLLDLHMPHLDGFEVMAQLAPWLQDEATYLPILVLSADATLEAKQHALTVGARDFLMKPFDIVEAMLRINNLLMTRFLHKKIQEQNETLEHKVRERTADLHEAIADLEKSKHNLRLSHEETIERLSIAAEYRDDETATHIHRMSHYCAILATGAGCDPEQCDQIRLASQLHDVGKLGTPDSILLKAGPLTPDERAEMQKHAEMGHAILADSTSDILQLAAKIALTHHERIDGKGYPRGLKGDEIPLEGRMAAIADVFDALTTDRVYRAAFPVETALEMMTDARGTQFDAELLDLFMALLPEILEAKKKLDDPLNAIIQEVLSIQQAS